MPDFKVLQNLFPDRWVSPSPKTQISSPYLERSPWKDHVLPADEVASDQNHWQQLWGKLCHDGRLILKYLGIYWRPYWVISVISSVCMMTQSAYELRAAQLMGMAIDQGAQALIDTALHLAPLLPIALGITLLGERLAARLSSRIVNDIRYDIFNHLQILSQDFHRHARLGDLLTRFSIDIHKIEAMMGKEFASGMSELVVLIVYFAVMLTISPSLAMLSLIPIVVTIWPTIRAMTRLSSRGLKTNNQKGLMLDAVQESIRGRMLIAGYGLSSLFASYFGDELKKLEDVNTEGLFSVSLFQKITTFSGHILSIWILLVGGIYVQSGAISIGTWLVFLVVCRTMHDTLNWFISMRLSRWVDAGIGLQRIDTLLQQQPQIVDRPDAAFLPAFQHQIIFDQVYFSYDGKQDQVQDLNLTIAAGQFVAFVGSSGAGKSTIFNLFMRFYDVRQGCITIDGHNIQAISQASLRDQIGIVLQDTFLFNASIIDNIRIVKPEATEAEVIAVAKAAELDDFVSSLPNGYHTIVGDSGGRLSGGQRQRIAIARALLRDPPILLLDEPTSSLSAEIAESINRTILSLKGQRTIIMITHQLPAAVAADQIFVLDRGRLAEQGTHAELLSRAGIYYHLWQVQTSVLKSDERLSEQGETTPDHMALSVSSGGHT